MHREPTEIPEVREQIAQAANRGDMTSLKRGASTSPTPSKEQSDAKKASGDVVVLRSVRRQEDEWP